MSRQDRYGDRHDREQPPPTADEEARGQPAGDLEVDATTIADIARKSVKPREVRPRFQLGRNKAGRTSLIDLATGEDFGRLITDVTLGVSCDALQVTLEMAPGVVEFARLDVEGGDR